MQRAQPRCGQVRFKFPFECPQAEEHAGQCLGRLLVQLIRDLMALGLLVGDQHAQLIATFGEVAAGVVQLHPEHGALSCVLELVLALRRHRRLESQDPERHAILGADRAGGAHGKRPVADPPCLDRDTLRGLLEHTRLDRRAIDQLHARPAGPEKGARILRKRCRKVLRTCQVGKSQTGLQQQRLALLAVAHPIAEAACRAADGEVGRTAREHSDHFKIGVGGERPHAQQPQRECGGATPAIIPSSSATSDIGITYSSAMVSATSLLVWRNKKIVANRPAATPSTTIRALDPGAHRKRRACIRRSHSREHGMVPGSTRPQGLRPRPSRKPLPLTGPSEPA